MTPELTKPEVAQEQLDELNRTLEKEKVDVTPEVEEYTRSHVRAVQDKLQAGQDVYESDLEFIPKVKMWVLMPKEWRDKYKSVEEMVKSEEMKDVTVSDIYEANKRNISLKQWLDLLHIAECAHQKPKWIDEAFIFPGAGKIETIKVGDLYLGDSPQLTRLPDGLEIIDSLDLADCKLITELPKGLKVGRNLRLTGCSGLTKLPKGLKVGRDLIIEYCTGLTKLPEGLTIGNNLEVSEDLNQQVILDAEKLKKEGKIKKILYPF